MSKAKVATVKLSFKQCALIEYAICQLDEFDNEVTEFGSVSESMRDDTIDVLRDLLNELWRLEFPQENENA